MHYFLIRLKRIVPYDRNAVDLINNESTTLVNLPIGIMGSPLLGGRFWRGLPNGWNEKTAAIFTKPKRFKDR